jgi:hypothetical protein
MSTDPETRRAIAQRAIDRAAVRGVPIDSDPAFVALLEEWIRGDVEFKEMRERYLDILALQSAERHGRWKNRIVRPRSVSSDQPIEE